MVDWWNPATWSSGTWQALGTGGTFVVAVVAAAFARRQVLEARDLRYDQSRPYVVVDFRTSEADVIFAEIVVENFGRTAAFDVSFEFDPPLESALFADVKDDDYHPARTAIFADGIPTLPPRKRYVALLDRGPDRVEAELPNRYTVTVNYTDGRHHSLSDTYTLDLGLYYSLRAINLRTVHHAAKALDEIRKTLEKWTAHLNGVRVYAQDEDALLEAQRREYQERLAKQGEADNQKSGEVPPAG